MKLKDSYIYLSGLRFHANHGVEAQERVVGNDYLLSLRLKVDVAQAMLTDEITDTVSYAVVNRLAAEEMAVPSQLLERVAFRIADRIARHYPQVEAVDVDLRKINPPMPQCSDGAGVKLHLINDKTP